MENRTFFTIGQAAEETGKAKSTIKKSIDNGELTVAERTKRGFKIEASELFRVFPRKTNERSNENEIVQVETNENIIENRVMEVKLKVAEERYEEAQGIIADLRQQRDKWQGIADKQTDTVKLLTHQQDEKPRLNVFQRIGAVFTG